MAIEGRYQVVVKLFFDVPPDMQPEQAGALIAHQGFSVSGGLLKYCSNVDIQVEEKPLVNTVLSPQQ